MNMQIFECEQFGQIRTVIDNNGEPLFCLKDVCKALLLEAKHVISRLDKGVVSKGPLMTEGGVQQATFVNEQGLYDVILDSRKPEAREFRKWVTGTVLPQIRKTGGYIPVTEEDDEKTILAKAIIIMKRTLEQKDLLIAEQESLIGEKDEIIQSQQPKVEYFNRVLYSVSTYTMTEVAKGLSMTVNELTKRLYDLGVIYRSQAGMLMLYAKYLKHGYEKYRTDHFRDRTKVVYRNKNDTICMTDTLLRTVTIKEKTSDSNMLTTIWKYLLAVTVLLVLVFIIRMIIQRSK